MPQFIVCLFAAEKFDVLLISKYCRLHHLPDTSRYFSYWFLLTPMPFRNDSPVRAGTPMN